MLRGTFVVFVYFYKVFAALKTSVRQNPWPAIGLLITAMVYLRFLAFGHISWDDPEMVFKNKAVRDFDLPALLGNHFVGNYIPLTMLVHALAWKLFGGFAGGHHAVNIVLHLLNGLLVYRIGKTLFVNHNVAGLCALVFWLHPVQMESVGWIAELKTLLSATFSLVATRWYLTYQITRRQAHWLYTFFLFVAACLSKSSAVVLPLAFVCFDLLRQKRFVPSQLLNKLPFLLVSLLFGIINIRTQTADQFINYAHAFPWHERLGFAGFALLRYALLFAAPVKLSVIYPYPTNTLGTHLTGYAVLLVLAATVVTLVVKQRWVLVSLLLFTLVNLVLVLQFIPFGEVLYADRYLYMPLAGFGWLLAVVLQRAGQALRVVTIALTLLLAAGSLQRSQVWQSAITLYEDILKHFPNSFVALNSVGVEHMLHHNDDKALYFLNRSIQVSPGNYKGYYNRGLLYLKKNNAREAIKSFDQAISIYAYPKAYIGRGSAYQLLGETGKAQADAQWVLRSDPNNPKAHFILANCYSATNELDKALEAYSRCIALNDEEADYYFKRAIVYGKKQEFALCLSDLNACIGLDPLHYEAFYWRGVAKVNLRQDPCTDFEVAARENYKPAVDAYYRYCR